MYSYSLRIVMSQQYFVYWYRLEGHTNPFTDGYIGITNDVDRRDKEHRRNKKATHFTNALALYGNLVQFQILHTTTVEEASLLEYAYRPAPNIGWNSAVGGIESTGQSFKQPITLYHQTNYVILHTFASTTEAAKALGLNIGRLAQAKSRRTNVYGYDGWAVLHDTMYDRSTTKSVQELLKTRLIGMPRLKPSCFKGMTNRWSEEEKQRISKQHKGKTISQAQKDAVGAANKANPTLCREIELTSRTGEVHRFHSIAEAARQLNLPLSRLKSKALRPLHKYGNDGWAITYLGPK